jgi:hypothetical protein
MSLGDVFYRRGAEGAEGGPGGAGPYRSNCGRSQSEFSLTLNLLNLIL